MLSSFFQACPDLVLVKGEDLSEYRRVSQRIFSLLRQMGKGVCPVERLGMDENFMDVSSLVEEEVYVDKPVGHVFGADATLPKELAGCQVIKNCHCSQRLKIGTVIAKRIRDKIFENFGITTSCGIGTNKLT